jgi:hypothetical protein
MSAHLPLTRRHVLAGLAAGIPPAVYDALTDGASPAALQKHGRI